MLSSYVNWDLVSLHDQRNASTSSSFKTFVLPIRKSLKNMLIHAHISLHSALDTGINRYRHSYLRVLTCTLRTESSRRCLQFVLYSSHTYYCPLSVVHAPVSFYDFFHSLFGWCTKEAGNKSTHGASTSGMVRFRFYLSQVNSAVRLFLF